MEDHETALAERTCLELLDLECVGRLVWAAEGRLHVHVVDYVRVGERVGLVVPLGSPVARLRGGSPVAFQVDQVDRDLQRGWSVVATGWTEVGRLRDDGTLPVMVAWSELTGRWVGAVGAGVAVPVRVDGRLVRVPVATG